ncbi:hypothetical protein [Mycobacterium colombiense]
MLVPPRGIARVGRIAYTSLSKPGQRFSNALCPLSDDHEATADALRAAGPFWTMLRNALYIDSLSPVRGMAAATNELVTNNGDGVHAPAARTIVQPPRRQYSSATVTTRPCMTSPACGQSTAPSTAALTVRHDRAIKVVHVSDEEYAKLLAVAGSRARPATRSSRLAPAFEKDYCRRHCKTLIAWSVAHPVAIEDFLAEG